MIPVPVSTIEKPLTAIDYIALLEQGKDVHTLAEFYIALPIEIVRDKRFTKAFQRRLEEIA